MAGLTLTLDTAKHALANTQLFIQTASNNIANADDTSYARQVVSTVENSTIKIQNCLLGTGASVESISQVRDAYVDKSLLGATSQQSMYDTMISQLNTVQAYLTDDGSTGLSSALSSFFDAWDALSQSASTSAEQTSVYSYTQNLVDTITSTYDSLSTIANTDIPEQISGDVDSVNSLLSQIAEYNKAIVKAEGNGACASDLRDARYEALTKLSELVPISYTEESNGSDTVTLADSSSTVTLVSGFKSGSLSYSTTTGLISYTQADGSTVSPSSNSIAGGEIGGLLTSLSDTKSYISSLNQFASTLITQVNSLQSTGGTNVFTGTNASDIAMVSNFLSGVSSSTETTIAASIAALQDTDVTFGTTSTTFSDYLSGIQEQIGLDISNATTKSDFYGTLVTSLQEQQQSVSGVSIDDELADLIKYQQIYQAAAKVITYVQQMLQTVINMAQ
jgi:flagellar hook-associated protein 1